MLLFKKLNKVDRELALYLEVLELPTSNASSPSCSLNFLL